MCHFFQKKKNIFNSVGKISSLFVEINIHTPSSYFTKKNRLYMNYTARNNKYKQTRRK